MKSQYLRGLFCTLLVGFLTIPAHATMVAETSIADLTQRATLIFVGTCQQRATTLQPFLGGQVPVTTYTFQIRDILKKPTDVTVAAGKSFQFSQQGGAVSAEQRSANVLVPMGAVSYDVGKEYMLFLRANKSGVYAPIGLHQGRLNVVTDASGRKSVNNGAYTKTLFRGVAAPADRPGHPVSKSVKSVLGGEHAVTDQGIALDAMKDVVNSLQGQ